MSASENGSIINVGQKASVINDKEYRKEDAAGAFLPRRFLHYIQAFDFQGQLSPLGLYVSNNKATTKNIRGINQWQ